jgi:translation initiation factor eIF-2B subunit epsilon
MNIEQDQTFTKGGSIWREKDVKLGNVNMTQLSNVVVSSGSSIGETATLTNSIIGRHCSIPNGAVVKDSVIWNNVTLNEGCKISGSVIMENNILPKNTQLGPGTVLLPKAHLPENSEISGHGTFIPYDSHGKPFDKPEDDEDEDESLESIPIGTCILHVQTLIIATLDLTDSEISEIEDSDDDDISPRHRRQSSASGYSEMTNEEFYTEAVESLSRAFHENHSVDNALIELKTLRMATNVTFHEVREAIISAIMSVVSSGSVKMEEMLDKWGILLAPFTEDEDAQVDLALSLQRYFAKRVSDDSSLKKSFVRGLQGLYSADVLEEDGIFRWFDNERAHGKGEKWGREMAALREIGGAFVTWLKEAEEESENE